jgi:uncharacterized protein YdgA (DUF945 family)
MKRWFVVLLVVLALVVLVSPGIIGRIAERNIEDNIQWAETENPAVHITTESFDRGWFTSEGRHRIALQGGQFGSAIAKYSATTGNPEPPSLIIETRMDHGLVPWSSLSRESGSLAPGLASTISTFQLDPGNGEPVELPGTLYSKVSLGGASDSRLVLEAGGFEQADTSIGWEGAELAISHDRGTGELAVHGTIKPWNMAGDDGGATIGAIQIDSEQVRTKHGISTGLAEVNVGAITINGGSGQVEIGGITFRIDSGIDDERFNTSSTIALNDVVIPGFGDVAVTFDSSMNRLHAESLGGIASTLRDPQGAETTDWAVLFPLIDDDLQELLSRGLEIRIDRLNVSLPQGTVITKFIVDVPAMDADADFTWPGVVLAMTASADLRVPAALYDLAAMMSPQAGSLLAMGILKKDGEDYVMEARYEQGLISVNGAPMPIPIPGL